MLPQWIELTEEEERAIDQIWATIAAETQAEAARERERERERLHVRRHNELRNQRRRCTEEPDLSPEDIELAGRRIEELAKTPEWEAARQREWREWEAQQRQRRRREQTGHG